METKRIFKVKIGSQKITADLEFDESNLECITGEIVHFKIKYKDIRAYEFQKPNNIAFNFYVDSKLKFVRISSKYALEIIESIKKSIS